MSGQRLTEYEKERLANIERNQAMLKSLGIYQAEVGPSKSKAEADARAAAAQERKRQREAEARAKRKRMHDEDSDSDRHDTPPRLIPRRANPPVTRRSSRLSMATSSRTHDTSENLNSDPIDFLSRPDSSPVRRAVPLKKLPPATIPERRSQRVHARNYNEEERDESEGRGDEEDDDAEEDEAWTAPIPTRNGSRTLIFEDAPHFTPNMTPEEMLREGSFGGTAFAEHYSEVLHVQLPSTDYTEFPSTWYANLSIPRYLTSDSYDTSVNRYRVKAGQSLSDWEKQGWIHAQDPRGWFQWYCRYYVGRRTRDDERQIKRWLGVCGPTGRFKTKLVKKIASSSGQWDDEMVSPIVRQTLQHWAYVLTEEDYNAYLA